MSPLRATARDEVVVVVEAVRLDDLVSDAWVVGERGKDDGLLAFSAPPLVEDMRDGLGAERATVVRVEEGDVEGDGPVLIEETEETRGRASEMSTVEGDLPEEGLGGRTNREEAILAPVLPRLTFLGRERREMSLVLNLLACVVRASVASDLDGPIEHAHHDLRRDEREGPPHVRVRDGIVVSVEADIRCLPRRDGAYEVGRSGVLGQREKTRSLQDERVADEATVGIGGDGPGALHTDDPRVELGIEVVHGVERASGKEGFAKIAYASLDASLLVAPRHGAGLGGKVVMTRKVEDPWVESNEVPLTLEDGALQVVVVMWPSALRGRTLHFPGYARRCTGSDAT